MTDAPPQPNADAAPTVNVALINPFVNACRSVFETMCGLEVERRTILARRAFTGFSDISGVMALTGAVTGAVAVSLPARLACLAFGNLLGEPPRAELDEDVRDGVRELTNMIAGAAKTALARTEYHFTISIPTIALGADAEVPHQAATPVLAIQFHSADEDFWLQIAIDPANRS